jgi:hypothetical protein
MKRVTFLLTVLGALSLGMAEDITTTSTIQNIDTQIEEIQNAPSDERVELMNQFKQRLMNMNEQERSEAIAQMQAKMQEHMSNGMQKEEATMNNGMTHAQDATAHGEMMQEHVKDMQMQEHEGMSQYQNMNQQQQYGDNIEHNMNNGSSVVEHMNNNKMPMGH